MQDEIKLKLQENLMKRLTILISVVSLFLCTLLYYMPSIESGLSYFFFEGNPNYKTRVELMEVLTGLEYLKYSSEEAFAGESKLMVKPEEGHELAIRLTDAVSADGAVINEDTTTRMVEIVIKGSGKSYFAKQPITGSTEKMESLDFIEVYGDSGIRIKLDSVYETIAASDDNYLYIDFVKPKDIYDKVVVIDAGHGAEMAGAVKDGVCEKTIDLEIVLKLKEFFDNSGYDDLKVYYTRLDDTNPEFADRVMLANGSDADLFVSIHNNSFVRDRNQRGTTVLYDELESTEGESSLTSLKLANILCDKVSEGFGSKNRGVSRGNDIYVIRNTRCPAALIEVGFMTNKEDLAALCDEETQRKVAQGIYEGIIEALYD